MIANLKPAEADKGLTPKVQVDFSIKLAVLNETKIGLPETLELFGSLASSKNLKKRSII